jgi:hypothetical protein
LNCRVSTISADRLQLQGKICSACDHFCASRVDCLHGKGGRAFETFIIVERDERKGSRYENGIKISDILRYAFILCGRQTFHIWRGSLDCEETPLLIVTLTVRKLDNNSLYTRNRSEHIFWFITHGFHIPDTMVMNDSWKYWGGGEVRIRRRLPSIASVFPCAAMEKSLSFLFLFGSVMLGWSFCLMLLWFGGCVMPSASTPTSPGPQSVSAGKALIIFVFKGDARSVCVAGDFNNWNTGSNCLHKIQNRWEAGMLLPQGRYRYAFIVDEKHWVPDDTARLQEKDGFGSMNSVLILEGEEHVEKRRL